MRQQPRRRCSSAAAGRRPVVAPQTAQTSDRPRYFAFQHRVRTWTGAAGARCSWGVAQRRQKLPPQSGGVQPGRCWPEPQWCCKWPAWYLLYVGGRREGAGAGRIARARVTGNGEWVQGGRSGGFQRPRGGERGQAKAYPRECVARVCVAVGGFAPAAVMLRALLFAPASAGVGAHPFRSCSLDAPI